MFETREQLMREFDERESHDQRPVGRIFSGRPGVPMPRCPECGLINKDYDLGKLCVPCWARTRGGARYVRVQRPSADVRRIEGAR